MTPAEFAASMSADTPPAALDLPLQALWWARKGDWDRAHGCAQARSGDAACDLVHAYLHREEGDLANAGYWYRRAGRPAATMPLAEEWQVIADQLLKK